MTERKPMAFMSYIHKADDNDSGYLTKFCQCLSQEVYLHTGEEFPIFQDRKDIGWGQCWRERIDDSLNHTTFLLPIITPGFFKSNECRNELKTFLEREKKLKRNDLILPILYIDTPAITKENLGEKDELAQIISSRQSVNWRKLRFEDLNSKESKKAISDLAFQIRNALERLNKLELSTESKKINLLHEAEASETNSSRFIDGRESDENSQIGSDIEKEIGEILRRLGSSNIPADRQHLLEIILKIQPQLQELQSKLVDWGEESNAWTRDFHSKLGKYCRIYAADVYTRSAMGSPRFNKYLREQYSARLRNLKLNSNSLSFSSPVYNAIIRTGWKPNPIIWSNPQIKEATPKVQENLEIVRILVRPKAMLLDRQELENLDFDHGIFAIPLFVLESEQLNSSQLSDFAIGFDKDKRVIKCYEFNETNGKVEEMNSGHGEDLAKIFDEILNNNTSLKTVGQFIRDLENAPIFNSIHEENDAFDPEVLVAMLPALKDKNNDIRSIALRIITAKAVLVPEKIPSEVIEGLRDMYYRETDKRNRCSVQLVLNYLGEPTL
jgi:hypothetical protein